LDGTKVSAQHFDNTPPEDFAGNRLKLAPRQCKAIAIDFGSAIPFGNPDNCHIHPYRWRWRNGLTLPKALKQSANCRQNLPPAFR
jgi:hypothetical protein